MLTGMKWASATRQGGGLGVCVGRGMAEDLAQPLFGREPTSPPQTSTSLSETRDNGPKIALSSLSSLLPIIPDLHQHG